MTLSDDIDTAGTTVFVLSTMFSMGLKRSVTQLFGALRDRRPLTKSLAVNLVAMPAIDPLAIGRMVLHIQIDPLLVGLALSHRHTSLGNRPYPSIQCLSDFSFVGLVVLLLVVYGDSTVSLVGTGTLGLSAVAVGVSLALRYAFGGPIRE